MVSPIRLIKHVDRVPEVMRANGHTPAWLTLLRYYFEIGNPNYPFHLPLRSGGVLTLSDPTEVKVFWNLFLRGPYTIPADCETILDCGANAGIFSVWAARHRPNVRIVALEPFPLTFAELEVNVRQTHLETQIQCVQVGLAAVGGDRSMRATGDSPDRRLAPIHIEASPDTITVRCIRLADCLQFFEMEKLDLLKMDIEGSEWEVLLSTEPSVLSRIRYIQIEYHEVSASLCHTPAKLFAHLAAAGHQITFRCEDAHHTGLAHFECATNPFL